MNTTDKQPRRFKLLKDISMPYKSIKAGTVGFQIVPSEYFSFGEGTNSLGYSIKDIEKAPDWFIEVKDQPLPERIEISRFISHENLKGNNWDSFFYQFCSSVRISPDKFPAIKQAIEAALNEDTVVDDIEEAGIAAVKISEQLNPKLTSREQAIFIAGFQECIKWQKSKTDTVVEDRIIFKSTTPESYDGVAYNKLWQDEAVQNSLHPTPTTVVDDRVEKDKSDYRQIKKWIDTWCRPIYCWTKEMVNEYFDSRMDLEQFRQSKKPNTKSFTKPTPTTVKEQEQKDWEVIAYKRKTHFGFDAEFHKMPNGNFNTDFRLGTPCEITENHLLGVSEIHSVRRKSDGVVFTVSDDTQFGKINSFEIDGKYNTGRMMVIFSDGVAAAKFDISEVSKAKPVITTNNDDVLFTTEDGVDIYGNENDVCINSDNKWLILPFVDTEKWVIGGTDVLSYPPSKSDRFKIFSKREAAEQYIIENKPCLSFKDIADADPSLFYNQERNIRILDKVKEKLKQ